MAKSIPAVAAEHRSKRAAGEREMMAAAGGALFRAAVSQESGGRGRLEPARAAAPVTPSRCRERVGAKDEVACKRGALPAGFAPWPPHAASSPGLGVGIPSPPVVVVQPVTWCQVRPVTRTAAAAGALAAREYLRRAALGADLRCARRTGERSGLATLPSELLQQLSDLLPTFADRFAFRASCAAVAGAAQWRYAPPADLDEELTGLGLGDLGAVAAIAGGLAAAARERRGGPRELRLGGNNIGDAGARAIAEALCLPGSQLRRLSLRDNRIGDAGALALAAALTSGRCALEELDLWGNGLGERGKAKLAAASELGRCDVFLELDVPPTLRPPSRPANSRMHTILFDWIAQVHAGLQLPASSGIAVDPQDFLFRTYSHIDALLASTLFSALSSAELQLAGVACMLASTRLHAQGSPDDESVASWLAFVTDGMCTPEEVREAAQEVRQLLGHRAYQPSTYTFLRRYLRWTGWTQESFSLANYLIELASIHGFGLEYRAQTVAAAAAVLSRQYLSHGPRRQHTVGWKRRLLRCAQVDLRAELAPCTYALSRLHAARGQRSSLFVNSKYALPRFHAVSRIAPAVAPDAAFYARYLEADAMP